MGGKDNPANGGKMVPKKSRVQKMSGGAAGGGAAQNANSDEARTAKPDERGADAMR
jgi:hypothetical protein